MCRCASTTHATRALEFGREEVAARVSHGEGGMGIRAVFEKIEQFSAFNTILHIDEFCRTR
jgi:hypothetical protein